MQVSTLWKNFSDLGWLSIPFSAASGGLEQGVPEAGIVAEAIGYYGVRVPYVTCILLCGGLIARAGTKDQQSDLLPKVMDGEVKLALAYRPEGTASEGGAALSRNAAGWTLNGKSLAVVDAEEAHFFLIAVVDENDSNARSDTSVFLVPRNAIGLDITERSSIDGSGLVDLHFNSVFIAEEAQLRGDQLASGALAASCDSAIIGWGFELVGIMQSLLERTRDFISDRQQFGRPVGANQVIRHRFVDMHILCEEASMLTRRAAGGCDDRRTRAMLASAVKAKVVDSAQTVAQEAIQLHGAMGFTDDLPIGRYLRRILAIRPLLGSPEYHLCRYGCLYGHSAE